MSFSSAISKRPSNCIVVQSHSGTWTAARVLQSIDQARSKAMGARLAIHLKDPGEAVQVLAALDGVAKTILLIAPSTPLEQIPALLVQAGIQAIITDVGEMLHTLGTPNVVRRIDELNVAITPQPSQATQWVLTTSGTTATPKLVAHTLETLTRTTKKDPIKNEDACWGLLYEWPRFAGLQVLLQSALSRSTLLAPAPDVTLQEKIDFLIHFRCSHLSATPTMWRKIIMTPGSKQLCLNQISLGGEIADAKILQTLSHLFPDSRITHIYASTEAGVGFSVNDGLPGFPENFLTTPPAGISLRISNNKLYIRSRSRELAYIGTETFFGDQDGWIDTGDTIDLRNGRCYFLGRSNGVINVAGNKVHPEEVENILLQYPGIQAARVYGKFNSFTGYLVAAEVVFDTHPEDVKIMLQRLQQYSREHLAPYKVPALITFATHIASSTTGKIIRKQE